MKTFVADFKTTNYKDDCRVWAFGLCDIENIDEKYIGNNIDEFMAWCSRRKENHKILFHRLEIEGQFIFAWLFKNGFRHTTEPRDRQSKTFNTLINKEGIYYQIEIVFERKGKTINKVTFQNSFNLIPLPIEKVAKAFKMPISRVEIDEEIERPIEHELTEEEKQSISNDIEIVATAVKKFYEQGLDKMTIGACALAEFKKMMGEQKFKLFFPASHSYDDDIRQSYKGGYAYLEKDLESKVVGNGVVLDYNSTHSYSMYDCELPYGAPIYYRGKYEHDELYPIYIQAIRCQFKLKKGFIPTVQLRHGSELTAMEYLEESKGEIVLHMTSVDLKLFFEHYDVYNEKYLGGWKFKSTVGFFKEYIDKWKGLKDKSKNENNASLYEIAKRMLNALYGKFGTLPQIRSKIPYVNKKTGIIEYEDSIPKDIEGVYLPLACFVTSYSRERIVRAFQRIKSDYESGKSKIRCAYTDTDSLHLISDDFSIPDWIETSDTKLGMFKIEGYFKKSKWLRQKCYIQEFRKPDSEEFKMKVTVSGMPETCHGSVTFKNFKIGTTYHGNMAPERVPGGVIQKMVDFTIKDI